MDSEGQGWKDRALNHEDRIAELEAALAEEQECADRLFRDRYDLLTVTSTDGLLSSEWVMRTATAERRTREAEAALAERDRQWSELRRQVEAYSVSGIDLYQRENGKAFLRMMNRARAAKGIGP